jgi:hypothetical protein
MRPFARKGALRSGASYVSTTHWPAQHYRAQEYSVALLGVMYPCAVQHCHDGPEHLEPTLPPEILFRRRSTDLIFYYPIHTDVGRIPQPTGEQTPVPARHEKPAGAKHASRRASIEAVVRDLAVLLLRKRPQ